MSGRDRRPGIAVVVLCRDYGRFLDEALASVVGQATSALPLVEVVVVDDGSTDETAAVAARWARQDPRIRVLTHVDPGGPVAAANAGVAVSTASHVLLLDADDRLGPGYLAACTEALLREGADVAFGSVRRFGAEVGTDPARPVDARAMAVENSVHKSALVSARLYDRGLRLDPAFSGLGQEDWALWLDALALGAAFVPVPGVWLEYRRHGSGSRNTMSRRRAAQIHLRLRRTRSQVRWPHVVLRALRSARRNGHGATGDGPRRAGAQAASLALQAGALALAARVLDGPGFTAYLAVVAVLAMAAAVSELGVPTAAALRTARRPADAAATAGASVVGSLATGGLALVVAVPVAVLVGGGAPGLLAVAAVAPAFLVRRATLAVEGVAAGLAAWTAVSWSRVLGPAAAVVVLVVLAVGGARGVWAVGVALLVGEVLSLVVLLRAGGAIRRPAPGAVRRLLAEAAPLGAIGALSLLHNRLDQPLLGLLGARDELAGYAVAYRPVDAVASLLGATAAVLLTRLAAGGRAGPRELRRSLAGALAVGTVVCAGLVVGRGPVTSALGGDHAGGAEGYLVGLAPAVILFAGLTATNQYVIAGGGTRGLLRLVAACTVANLGLNLVLIPVFGAAGAVVATLATGVANLAGSLALARAATRPAGADERADGLPGRLGQVPGRPTERVVVHLGGSA